MTVVAEILKSKPEGAVHSIAPSATVLQALQSMAERHIGALLVMENGAIVGILTERDYARKIALMGRTSVTTLVSDVMTTAVMYVEPTQTSEECMALMTQNRLRHLPVVENGTVLGMVSIGDLVKNIISEQEFIIEQMKHYISGSAGSAASAG